MIKKKLLGVSISFIFGSALFFLSCKKDPFACAAPPYPPAIASYNMTAHNGGQLLTFVAQADFTSTKSAIGFNCLWQTGNSADVNNQLYFNNIILNKGVIGNYPLSNNPYVAYSGENGTGPLYSQNSTVFGYATDATHTGTLSITEYDSINHFISGTFSFTGNGYYIDQCGTKHNSTVSITGGTFTDVPTY